MKLASIQDDQTNIKKMQFGKTKIIEKYTIKEKLLKKDELILKNVQVLIILYNLNILIFAQYFLFFLIIS